MQTKFYTATDAGESKVRTYAHDTALSWSCLDRVATFVAELDKMLASGGHGRLAEGERAFSTIMISCTHTTHATPTSQTSITAATQG